MGLFDLIFPRKCLGCGRYGNYICESCLRKTRTSPKICIECEKLSVDGITHTKCKRPLGLDGAVSVWAYEGVIRKAILKLKYKFALEIAQELASLVAYSLNQRKIILPPRALLVPIPLHRLRGNWRGFNQAEEMGRLIAQKMGWNFIPDLLVRKKMIKAQTELKGDERLKNIRGVFALNSSYQLTNQRINQSLVLFDDVLTTGATLKEAAKVLKRDGAKGVWGLTIAG